jgi:hypothetical protein
LLQIDICRFDTSSFINVHQVCKFQQACCKLMTSTSLLQLVDNLQHAGKIRNLQQVCDVSGYECPLKFAKQLLVSSFLCRPI